MTVNDLFGVLCKYFGDDQSLSIHDTDLLQNIVFLKDTSYGLLFRIFLHVYQSLGQLYFM